MKNTSLSLLLAYFDAFYLFRIRPLLNLHRVITKRFTEYFSGKFQFRLEVASLFVVFVISSTQSDPSWFNRRGITRFGNQKPFALVLAIPITAYQKNTERKDNGFIRQSAALLIRHNALLFQCADSMIYLRL